MARTNILQSETLMDATDQVRSLVSWKAIFAGIFVTVAVYTLLLSLGLGVSASTAQDTIEKGGSLGDVGKGSAAYVAVATLFSLAAGGYFTARVSTFFSRWQGAAQGLVVASLFLAVMIYGVGQTVGAGLRGMASAFEVGATSLASSPMVQNTIEDSLADVPLKTDLPTVAKGVLTRLAAGQTDSARAYLVSQSTVPESVVNEKFTEMQTRFTETAKSIGSSTASGVAASAYGIFWISLLGLLCASGGGAFGAHLNRKRPLELEGVETTPFQTRTAV